MALKTAVVLFNLGAPDSLETVEPYLRNLFSDPSIIPLPFFLRIPLARFIARRRAPITKGMYERIGGRSPLLDETKAQAEALEAGLRNAGLEARCFVAMRHWKPFTEETVEAVKAWGAEHVVLLPLYPQYSTTTTGSALSEWMRLSRKWDFAVPATRVCCYPWEEGFVRAEASLLERALADRKTGLNYRVLFSAHGLPKRIVERGDPYQWQVERTAEAILRMLPYMPESVVCYQSRVGPLEWIGPSTEAEVRRAGRERMGIIVLPISFVSEHSETLVELDLDYGERLAREAGVPHYIRVPTVRTNNAFVEALAELVMRASKSRGSVTCAQTRVCPGNMRCGYVSA